jgi:transcriptional regulator with XRE-family HTH domain
MNERLTTFLRAEQLSPSQFADFMGIQRSGVSHILSGRNKPGFDFFSTFLHKFPAVNIEWLISGRGKMYKDMETKPLFPEFAPLPEIKDTATVETPTGTPPNQAAVTENPAPPATSAKAPESRRIEKVVVLYSDSTFSDFVRP